MTIYFYKTNEKYGCFSNFAHYGFELDEKYREECMRRLETEGTMPASVFDEMNEDAEKK